MEVSLIMPRISKKVLEFDEAINDFMIYSTNKDLSRKTLKSYEASLKLFAKYIEAEKNIYTPIVVTTRDIKDYLEFTKSKGKYSFVTDEKTLEHNNPLARGDFGKEISLYTVNNYLRNLKVFFNWLQDSGVIKVSPMKDIKQYKHSRKPKNTIKDFEFNNLIKILDLTKFCEYRDYIIVQLLLDTGMRIGETLKLKMENILIDKKAIFIPMKINKGRKDRYVFFSMTMQK